MASSSKTNPVEVLSSSDSEERLSSNWNNWTVTGSSVQDFAAVVAILNEHHVLWSCLCDKKGDWAVSADDGVHGNQLRDWLKPLWGHVSLIPHGEMTFTYEAVAAASDAWMDESESYWIKEDGSVEVVALKW